MPLYTGSSAVAARCSYVNVNVKQVAVMATQSSE